MKYTELRHFKQVISMHTLLYFQYVFWRKLPGATPSAAAIFKLQFQKQIFVLCREPGKSESELIISCVLWIRNEEAARHDQRLWDCKAIIPILDFLHKHEPVLDVLDAKYKMLGPNYPNKTIIMQIFV